MLSIAAKNGIILAAESRANFYNERGVPAAYFDKVDKVFMINERLGLATTTNELIGGKLLSVVLKDFANSKENNTNINNICDKLFNFLAKQLPTNATLLKRQQFIIAGYKGDEPIRVCKDNSGIFAHKGFAVIQSIKPPTVQVPSDTQNLTQRKAVELAKRIIKDYAQNGVYGDGIPAWQRVGGSIDILWIPRNKRYSTRWLRKKKGHGFKDIRAFLKWVKETEQVKLIGGFGGGEIERIISKIERQPDYLE